MLEITKEFRKGILFIRLKGELNNKTINLFQKEVNDLIENNGIMNIVINCEQIKDVDIKGINSILESNNLSIKNKGKTILCGVKEEVVKHKMNNTTIFKYMFEIGDELSAIEMFKT